MARVSALRRVRAEAFITSAALVAVGLALVLLASGPIFADAVSTGALRRSLVDAPSRDSSVVIDGRLWLDEVEEADDVVVAEVESAMADIDPLVLRSIEASTAYAVPQQPSETTTDLVRLGWLEGLEDHVSLVAGRWPASSAGAGANEVLIDASAAAVFGVDVGQALALTARGTASEPIEATIVGTYRIDDPFGSFWQGRDRIAEPVTVTSAFRTVNLLGGRDAVLQVTGRPDVGWLVLPAFAGFELDEVDRLRARLRGLEGEINARLFDPEAEQAAELAVRSGLPDLLVDDDRSLTVARAVIFATVAQLSALAAFALTLVAGLGVDARRNESTLLRARGADPGQLTRQATVDALIVVAPMALVAPLIAVGVVGWFDEFGPLASIDLELDPRPIAAAWWTTAVAAIVTVGLLVLPAARAATAAAAEGAGGRSRVVGLVQRSGIDLAVLAAAGFAYWQLRVLGDERTADLRGRFGVDPLVVLAPVFGIVAGALIVLRVLPLAVGLAERFVERRRGAVGALTVWQLARRPHRYTRTALLVTMAIAVGTFASTYEVTWAGSQQAQAAHEVSTDIRVVPNRRVGDSVSGLQLSSVLGSIDGVRTVMATTELATTLPGSADEGRLVALEATAADALDEASDPATVAALVTLRERRPEIPGVELPGSPVELAIPTSIVEVDEVGQPVEQTPDPDLPPPPPPLAGSLTLTLEDADGLFHAVDAGPLAVDTPTRRVVLSAEENGASAVPRAPLRIVDVQLDTVNQGAVNRLVEVTLGPVEVVDRDGTSSEVSFGGVPFAITTDVLGFLAAPSSATVSSSEDGSMSIRVRTGASLLAVRVVHTITRTLLPDDAVMAGAADRRWADAAAIAVGDVIEVPSDRIDGLRVEVVALVDVVPGVDPTTTPAVLVDLPSMQWHERAPGRPPRDVSEYWLELDPARDVGVDAFARPPVEAVEVISLDDRRAELTANPPALGSLGALGAGFLASVILAMTALVLTAVVSMRERAAEFAVLDALGLSRTRRRGWLFREQLVIVGFGVVIGTGIGLAMALLVLPVTSLAQDGGVTFPAVEVVVPWRRVLGLALGVGAMSLVAVGVSLALRARGSTGTALRTGVDG